MTAEHGTATAYQRGCRCDSCRHANTVASSRYSGRPALVEDCTIVTGSASACSTIAGLLVATQREVERVARLANRSEATYRRYSTDLATAKAARDKVRRDRDEHAAVCPAAAARFGVTA